jgi:hypothetical protein
VYLAETAARNVGFVNNIRIPACGPIVTWAASRPAKKSGSKVFGSWSWHPISLRQSAVETRGLGTTKLKRIPLYRVTDVRFESEPTQEAKAGRHGLLK